MRDDPAAEYFKSVPMDKYFICYPCSLKKNMRLPDGYVGTVSEGLCGWCGSDKVTTMVPLRDFYKSSMKKGVK